jgi:hypothetical protein
MHSLLWMNRFLAHCLATALLTAAASAQVTTTGFSNAARTEPPGTLLSHPNANGSANMGRTTSVNYFNGWVIVGAEAPGSAPGSDLVMRVYDIANPANPVRRYPSDFGLSYPNNRWYQGNYGWGAHGTAWSGQYMLPDPIRVQSFGGIVEMGGQNGIPSLGSLALGYNRSSQSGPWDASMQWYGSPDTLFEINRVTNTSGFAQFQTVATFDHTGPFGGGDWHPQFFGDLLIYMRSGGSAQDGVVVYRLTYNNYDDPAQRSITPNFVGSLPGGFLAYWPTLFSDGSGLYVIGSGSDSLMGADITQAASPSGTGAVTLSAQLTVPGFSNASYPCFRTTWPSFIIGRSTSHASWPATRTPSSSPSMRMPLA